jgi:hypothetical protein
MTKPVPTAAHSGERGRDELGRVWTGTNRFVGSISCYTVFGLGLAYLPTTVAGLVDRGLDAPIRDPYLAVMELLIIPLALGLVVAFAAVHAYAEPPARALSLSALVLVAITAGMTIGVHAVALTVGRQPEVAALPGFALLFSWTWPSAIYALDIAAWDLCLGIALLLAAPIFPPGPRSGPVRRGLVASGALCLAGLLGVILNNMSVRNIGILGYAVVLPVVMLLMGRLFATAQPATGP